MQRGSRAVVVTVVAAITLLGSLILPPPTSSSIDLPSLSPLAAVTRIPGLMARGLGSLFGPSVAGAAEPQQVRTEITDVRARDEKVYDNHDGTLTSVFRKDIHYLAGPGRWEDVDLTFRRTGADDVVDRAQAVTRVTGRGVGVTDRLSGVGIRWLTPARPQASGRTARFAGQRGLDWIYHARPHGVKLTATVQVPQGPALYTFAYELIGVSRPLVLQSDGSLANDTLRVPPPTVEGADASSLAVGPWQILGPNLIGFALDDTAYPAASFPYQIDPTTSFATNGANDDGFAHGGGPTWPSMVCTSWNDTATYHRTSRKWEFSQFNMDNGMQRWWTASLPDTATINGARLKAYVYDVDSSDGNRNFLAEWYTGAYGCPAWTGTNTNDAFPSGVPLSSLTLGERTFTLSNANTTNISRTGTTGIRHHLSGTGLPTGINEVKLATWDHPSYLAPTLEVDYNNAAPNTPSMITPESGAFLDTARPTFKATGTDPNGDALSYEFKVRNDVNCGWATGWIASSGLLATTTTWTPPPGVLAPETTYHWCVRTKDRYVYSAAQAGRPFTIRPESFGDAPDAPMWSYGPLSVNRATGNLVVAAGGPSLPSPGGGASVSAAFNSFETGSTEFGAGWRMTAGDAAASPPAALIDRTIAAPKLDAIEVVGDDGSSTLFAHVGDSAVYAPPPEEDGSITKDAGKFTLSYPDGSRYAFSTANATTGEAELTGVEVVGDAGEYSLTHAYSPTDPSKVTSITAADGRQITFTWNALSSTLCTDAIVCVTGTDGATWRYRGTLTGGTTGSLSEVVRGTRVLLRLSYGSGRITEVRTANDVASGDASPGHDPEHKIVVTYDASNPARVATVKDDQLTIDGTANTSATYTLTYLTGGTTAPTAQAHTGLAAGSTRTAVGRTQLTAPDPDGAGPLSGGTRTVYHDDRAREIQATDALGNITQTGYDARDRVLWTEDAGGGATDNTFDAVTDQLLTTAGPDPDGTGALPRPVTTYRYDETAVGTAATSGPALLGLQTANHAVNDLSGEPTSRTTSASIDANWGVGAPTGLPTDNFSVRYSGLIDIPQAGDYVFSSVTSAADGLRLTVGAFDAIDAWAGDADGVTESQPIEDLPVGKQRITLDYRDFTGNAEVHLSYRCEACAPQVPKQIVPSANLRPNYGNQTSVVDPMGNVAFTHFADPTKAQSDYELQTLADGTKIITAYTYDSLGRVTVKTHPNGNAARTIDGNGNLTGSPDTRYQSTFAYYAFNETPAIPAACGGGTAPSQAGALRSLTHYGHAAQVSVYDAAGRQIAATDGSGTTCTTYDAEARVASVTPPTGAATTYTYDAEGRARTVTEGALVVRTDYDERGNAVFTRDASGAEAGFRFDGESRPTRRAAALGALGGTEYVQTYAYDADGQLTSLTDPAARTWRFGYDARGAVTKVAYPNDTFSWYTYDQAGRLTDLHHRGGTLADPLPATEPADPTPIAEETYTYDTVGKRTRRVRRWDSSAETTDYAYDAAGRLSQVLLPGSPTRTDRRYIFDVSSNRTEIREAAEGLPPVAVETYTYDATKLDRLTSTLRGGVTTSFTYDTDGNALTKGPVTYTYDTRGRHTGATVGGTTADYAFDPAGRRLSRTQGATTTSYLYAGGGALTFGVQGGAIVEASTDSQLGDLARFSGSPTTGTGVSFLYLDAHGTPLAEADTLGARTALHAFDPFGVPLTTWPASTTVEGFTGKWSKRTDTFSTLVEMGARAYDPSLGRFVQVDPVEGGSLNLYEYALQEPTGTYDLDGRFAFAIPIGIAAWKAAAWGVGIGAAYWAAKRQRERGYVFANNTSSFDRNERAAQRRARRDAAKRRGGGQRGKYRGKGNCNHYHVDWFTRCGRPIGTHHYRWKNR